MITLNGRAVLKHAIGSEYVDEGASVAAADGTELDSAELLVTGIVDHAVAGSYVLTYNYVDLLGRPAETKQRIVVVGDLVAPVITLEGEETIEHIAGQEFVDPGIKIEDNIDQSLSGVALRVYLIKDSFYTLMHLHCWDWRMEIPWCSGRTFHPQATTFRMFVVTLHLPQTRSTTSARQFTLMAMTTWQLPKISVVLFNFCRSSTRSNPTW